MRRHVEALKEGLREGAATETSMLSLADPACDYYGSAMSQNPVRLQEINEIYNDAGVEVVVHSQTEEKIAYEPSLQPGKPGRLHRTSGMSLSAEEHELDHFIGDRQRGYPGLSYYLKHPDEWDKMEVSAYNREIEMARQDGNEALASELEQLLDEELKRRGR